MDIQLSCDIISHAQIDHIFRQSFDFSKFTNDRKSHKLSHRQIFTGKLNIAILGYKSNLVNPWDPFDTSIGLPGSEEAVVYASQSLVEAGHSVTIYMNPPVNSIWSSVFSNPQWLSVDDWSNINDSEYDFIIMWRRFDVDTARKRGKIVFCWIHDSPQQLPPNFQFPPFPNFNGIYILSNHHRSQYNIWPGFNEKPYTICGNGLNTDQFTNPCNFDNPYSIGYFSNYARGLIVLMVIWLDIRREFPKATLSICYGRETWNTMPPLLLQYVINKIEEYKDMGITEYGKVGHDELATIMQKTSIWAYPCNYMGLTETFCITAIKCQAAGCVPVTTRIGALNETVHIDAPSSRNIVSEEDAYVYRDKLLETLRRVSNTDTKAERLKYIEYGKRYTWTACTDKWLELYEKVSK